LEIIVVIAGVLLGGLVGVGTVVFAIGIGPLVQWLLPRFDTRPVGQRTAH
jgi:uncharacterized membrane protein YczE